MSRRSGSASERRHPTCAAESGGYAIAESRRGAGPLRHHRSAREENGLPTFASLVAFYAAWAGAPRDPATAAADMEAALAERRRLGDRWQESALSMRRSAHVNRRAATASPGIDWEHVEAFPARRLAESSVERDESTPGRLAPGPQQRRRNLKGVGRAKRVHREQALGAVA